MSFMITCRGQSAVGHRIGHAIGFLLVAIVRVTDART
jgi:hypothetical protein